MTKKDDPEHDRNTEAEAKHEIVNRVPAFSKMWSDGLWRETTLALDPYEPTTENDENSVRVSLQLM